MSAEPDSIQMYGVEETAKLLDIGPDAVRGLLARGELVGRRIGNRWRIPRWSILAWQERGERPPAAVVQMRRRNG